MKTGNPSVIVCAGPERWLVAQTVQRLKQTCLKSGFEEMDFVRFEEPPDEVQSILEAIRTAPFGSSARLVVVDGFEELGLKEVPWLADYLARPNATTCLVLCAEKLDRELQRVLQRQKPGVVGLVNCQPLKGAALRDWIVEQARVCGKQIESDAANLLVTRLGPELLSLASALETLTLLVGETKRITAADVEALIPPSVRETAFDILDTAAGGHPARAMELLRQAIVQGQLSVEQLMGAFGWYYRMAWKARAGAGSGGSAAGGWMSPSRQAALSRLGRWPQKKLQGALEEILVADASLKLGHPASELLADRLLSKLGGN